MTTDIIAIGMRKLFLVCALLIGSTVTSIFPVIAAEATISSDRQLPDDAREITVFKLVHISGNAWSASKKTAYYSRSENLLYIDEGQRKNQTYTVNENRAYGQSNDGRAEYRYTAGGYYFNL